MNEDAYTKGLAKNQVCAIFYMQEIWENVFIRRGALGWGGGGGNQYRNTVRKIGKYRNTVSKIDEIPIPHFMIGHAYLTFYPSRVFFTSSMYAPEINLSLREKT